MKQKVCILLGFAGALVCTILASVSFLFIQDFLFKLDLVTLLYRPVFYVFAGSIVGVSGSVVLMVKKPSVSVSDDVSSSSIPEKSSEKESVVSSGASGFLTLLPGTKLQNESGTTLELAEHYIMWPKFAKVDVPEVDVAEEAKEQKKTVVVKRRFFERVSE